MKARIINPNDVLYGKIVEVLHIDEKGGVIVLTPTGNEFFYNKCECEILPESSQLGR